MGPALRRLPNVQIDEVEPRRDFVESSAPQAAGFDV